VAVVAARQGRSSAFQRSTHVRRYRSRLATSGHVLALVFGIILAGALGISLPTPAFAQFTYTPRAPPPPPPPRPGPPPPPLLVRAHRRPGNSILPRGYDCSVYPGSRGWPGPHFLPGRPSGIACNRGLIPRMGD